jgi:hypothetical protein
MEKPGWDRNIIMNSFSDWVEDLSPLTCHDFNDVTIETNTITFESGLLIELPPTAEILIGGDFSEMWEGTATEIRTGHFGGSHTIDLPKVTHKVSFRVGWLDWQDLDENWDSPSEALNDRISSCVVQGYDAIGNVKVITVRSELDGNHYFVAHENSSHYVRSANIVVNGPDLKKLTVNFGDTAVLFGLCFADFGCD